MLDLGRQYDLEELYNLRNNAKSGFERDRFEQVIDKILRETVPIRSLREELTRAIRHDDIRTIKRCNHELRMIQANQTYGHDY